ncbi:hypothetical protein QLQ15_15530 [Lysobacter sp. LF1]|uniref:DUF6891 domain-containing protein n=1 Tax=Lysobacter stagni TaxID=3045172 RepID=A0ABT6XJR9_9GAMM|nr:hypothetical protein [Lysobacter sp. LF1]MDI9240319.1 hypothetical protein [Lysobacter sp. LF1]
MAWNWFAGLFRRGNGVAPADAQAFDELVNELRDYIVRDLRGGYVAPDAIVEGALEVVDAQPHGEALLRTHAQRILEDEISAYRTDSAAWPALTDHDRLEQAFATLESQGVVCRQNFTCCGTCGVAEIGEEMRATRERGGAVQGYAFFHMQDTESAIDGHGLYLNYGAVEEDETAAKSVARSIVAAMSAAGLPVEWDGDWGKRIRVGLQWQRRLAL